jgi:transaldolase/glucose-6-phosphate isomerase
MSGRDKLTLALPPRIAALGAWIEQLVAESTGKKGCGLLPVDGEPLAQPALYGRDRIFVQLELDTTQDDALSARVGALAAAEHPTVRLELAEPLALGAEMLRWEIAVATASAVLGVNAFDEPDVKLAKSLTARQLDSLERRGRVEEPPALHEEWGVGGVADEGVEVAKDQPRLSDFLEAHFRRVESGDYVALLAYVRRTDRLHYGLELLREELRQRLRVAVTIGYGPRYLHSTGQLHKGGPNRGVFLMLTHDATRDLAIPGRPWTFSQLEAAQAAGDHRALCDRRRRVLRLHLSPGLVHALPTARAALDEALRRLPR